MINGIKVFVRAVDMGNISAAARTLRISAAAANHRIVQLEKRLGTRLLNRTTRSLQCTQEGGAFYHHALEVISAMERAESSVACLTGRPVGSVLVTAPVGFGQKLLPKLVMDYNEKFPDVQVQLRLSDHLLDILNDSIDVAIRMSVPKDSSLIGRKIGSCPRILCASPGYLEKHGTPRIPDDLLQHNCLLLRFPGSTQFRWKLNGPDGPVILPVSGSFDANHGEVLTDWALHDAGITLKAYWEVAEHLASGALVQILPNFPPEPVSLMALYPHKSLVSQKVRSFVDFLANSSELKAVLDN